MDVLKGKKNQHQNLDLELRKLPEMTQEKREDSISIEASTSPSADDPLDGKSLIDQVVSLSGLPEDLAHQELNQILRLSEMASPNENLTLEDLRSAMLVYLEQLAIEQEKNDLMQHLH